MLKHNFKVLSVAGLRPCEAREHKSVISIMHLHGVSAETELA